jgi:hypothetical protein
MLNHKIHQDINLLSYNHMYKEKEPLKHFILKLDNVHPIGLLLEYVIRILLLVKHMHLILAH